MTNTSWTSSKAWKRSCEGCFLLIFFRLTGHLLEANHASEKREYVVARLCSWSPSCIGHRIGSSLNFFFLRRKNFEPVHVSLLIRLVIFVIAFQIHLAMDVFFFL